MKKYNVNIDRQKPSSDEILSRRNFDGLMKQYQAAGGAYVAKPFWKKGWFAGSVVAGIIGAVAIVFMVNGNSTNKTAADSHQSNTTVNSRNAGNTSVSTSAFVSTKKKVAPPIKGLDVSFTKFSLSAAKGGTITYNTGSKLIFPADCFVDGNGNVIHGNIEIHYREFRDPVDIFVAGIPMEYDSAGSAYQFESAGMMEVTAFCNGKQVYLDKNKNVEIQFSSEQRGSKFSVYLFDTVAGNWKFHSKDKVEEAASDVQLTPAQQAKADKERKEKIAALEKTRDEEIAQAFRNNTVPAEPKKPIKADRKKQRFTIDFQPREFPELMAYKDVVWMVDESKENFDQNIYKIEWDKVTVAKGSVEGKYVMTLHKGSTPLKLEVFPAYNDEGYANAMKEFNARFDEYNAALDKRNKAEQTARSNYEMMLNRAGVNSNNSVSQANRQANNDVLDHVLRVFTINSFGIYNCDCAGTYPNGTKTQLSFVDEKGQDFTSGTSIYHVDRNRFGLYLYSGNPVAIFSFDQNSSNLIWTVKDGGLYTADNDQFQNVKGASSAEFVMHPVKESFASLDEMKMYFGIHAKK